MRRNHAVNSNAFFAPCVRYKCTGYGKRLRPKGPWMKSISAQNISAWRSEKVNNQNHTYPGTVDLLCHNCGKGVAFTTNKWIHTQYSFYLSNAHCPRCKARTNFILLGFSTNQSAFSENTIMWVHPSAQQKEPMPDLEAIDEFSEPLVRAYQSTLNVFNSKEWTATAVLARRLLEGVTKSILPEDDHNLPLAKQLEKLPQAKDLSLPILNLAAEIRKGGNLGAHFDLEKEPDEEVSRLMVDLLEDLIEYLFVIPLRIQNLKDKLEALSNERDAE